MTTKKPIIEVAKQLEETINSEIGFSEVKAVLMGISNIHTEMSWQVASRHGDVYELLSSANAIDTARHSDAVAVITCGWAAPVGNDEADDIPPSIHPARRRVRLCIVADNASRRVSVLRFEDDPDNTIVEEGTAKGSLADAVADLFKQAQGGGYL